MCPFCCPFCAPAFVSLHLFGETFLDIAKAAAAFGPTKATCHHRQPTGQQMCHDTNKSDLNKGGHTRKKRACAGEPMRTRMLCELLSATFGHDAHKRLGLRRRPFSQALVPIPPPKTNNCFCKALGSHKPALGKDRKCNKARESACKKAWI